MQLYFYRFFVNPTRQIPLFGDELARKKEIVKNALIESYSFEHRGTILGYVCERIEDNYIYAKIGKKSQIVRRLPPDQKFEEQREENWPYCRIYLNLDTDPDKGQTIAFEYRTNIFEDPLNQLRALSDEINTKLSQFGMVLSINPISTEHEFWEVVERDKGAIEEIVFNFVAPNLFNLQTTMEQDLRAAKEVFGITNTDITLKNQNGSLRTPPDNPFLKESVEYITKGGGEYKVKAHGRYTSSKSKVKSATTSFDLDIKTQDKAEFIAIMREIFHH